MADTGSEVGPVEIACDESGFTGGNLTFRDTVFVHASIRISAAVAQAEMDRLGHRVSARGELKAGWLLRWADRVDLRRLLDPRGPILEDARVHLIDSRLFLLCRLTDVALGSSEVDGLDLPGIDPGRREPALALRRDGERVFGTEQWDAFLTAAGNALRTNSRWVPATAVTDFEEAADRLASAPAPAAVREATHRLRTGGGNLRAARQALEDDPRRSPLLEPLLPALTRAVLGWSAAHPSLVVVHDEQSALTPWRVADIARLLAARHPGHTLDLVRVDSRVDARVQVADLVAGIARRAASSVLTGQPADELVELVRPLIDPESLWPDDQWAPSAASVCAERSVAPVDRVCSS
jgi:hypothetical protein